MIPSTNYLINILGENDQAKKSIRSVPTFRFCSDQLLDLLYSYSKVMYLKQGDELTREGNFDQWVYFMLGGRLDVYVGGNLVETIHSPLVGERSILGETRGATLKARKEGAIALAVDVALMDAVFSEEEPSEEIMEELPIYLELLTLITAEILNRIVELCYTQLETRNKHIALNKVITLNKIVTQLRRGELHDNPEINHAIHEFVQYVDPELAGLCWDPSQDIFNTGKLSSYCMHHRSPLLLQKLARYLYHKELIVDPDAILNYVEFISFEEISHRIFERVLKEMPKPLTLDYEEWNKYFSLDNRSRIQLGRWSNWMRTEHKYDEHLLIRALLLFLEEASSFNQKINQHIKQMLDYITMNAGNKSAYIVDILNLRQKDIGNPQYTPLFEIKERLVEPYVKALKDRTKNLGSSSDKKKAAPKPAPAAKEELDIDALIEQQQQKTAQASSQDDIDALIEQQQAASQDDIDALIEQEKEVSQDDIDALIEQEKEVSQDDIDALIEQEKEVSQDDIDALIEQEKEVSQDDIDALIEQEKEVSQDDIDALIEQEKEVSQDVPEETAEAEDNEITETIDDYDQAMTQDAIDALFARATGKPISMEAALSKLKKITSEGNLDNKESDQGDTDIIWFDDDSAAENFSKLEPENSEEQVNVDSFFNVPPEETKLGDATFEQMSFDQLPHNSSNDKSSKE